MKGLELSRAYYETYGAPMLSEQFPDLLGRMAVGLVGAGSECLGYDDAVSQDHDFEPGFCIFLPPEDQVSRREAFLLERAYAKLPKEFMGLRRSVLSPVGGNRHGVIRLNEFLESKLGVIWPDEHAWMNIPEQYFLEVTNGELFRDDEGTFTKIREYLSVMPPDVRKKKLAGQIFLMAQSGEYNFMRCIAHGEYTAAQVSIYEYTRAAIHIAFLVNGRYKPYYKWVFRALRELPMLSELEPYMRTLLTTKNVGKALEKKQEYGNIITNSVKKALMETGFVASDVPDLGKLADEVNDSIEDGWIRNLNILYAT